MDLTDLEIIVNHSLESEKFFLQNDQRDFWAATPT